MPTNRKSAGESKTSRPKHSARGRRLIAGLDEVAAHLRGEDELAGYEVKVPEQADVPALRAQVGLSQARFARAFGLDVATVAAWEQGRRRPDRTARILLAVIAREPEAVRRALDAGRVTNVKGAGDDSPSIDALAQLAANLAALPDAGGHLETSVAAFGAVIQYLQVEAGGELLGSLRPLTRLYMALHDVLRGGRPPLLFDAKLAKLPGVSKPTNQFRDYLRGQLAEALSGLALAGMSLTDAGRFMEVELHKVGCPWRRNKLGDPIRGRDVLRWRHEVMDTRAPKAQREGAALAAAKRLPPPQDASFDYPAYLQRFAIAIVQDVARVWESENPPRES